MNSHSRSPAKRTDGIGNPLANSTSSRVPLLSTRFGFGKYENLVLLRSHTSLPLTAMTRAGQKMVAKKMIAMTSHRTALTAGLAKKVTARRTSTISMKVGEIPPLAS